LIDEKHDRLVFRIERVVIETAKAAKKFDSVSITSVALESVQQAKV
jgi:hypothetical protein